MFFKISSKNIAKPFAGGEVAAKALPGCTAGRKGGHFGPEVKIIAITHIFTLPKGGGGPPLTYVWICLYLKIQLNKFES